MYLLYYTQFFLKDFFSALSDCTSLLSGAGHLESSKALSSCYASEVETFLREEFVEPLCREVEDTLRLEALTTVAHSQLENTHHDETFLLLDSLEPITFADKTIRIKGLFGHFCPGKNSSRS